MNKLKSNYDSWTTIRWPLVERRVVKWQNSIYLASKENDFKKLRSIQKMLVNSLDAKLLAVRRVTQDNKGKVTAGVDKVKNLTPQERLEMAKALKLPIKAQPLRRIWIPKPGKPEKRPLGIPVMRDRCAQALLKLAIEPEWEAKFEKDSYGFRPGRSAHDALSQIRAQIQQKPKYVLDADIAKCFDRIDHNALLEKSGYKGMFRTQIKYWLKAGALDGETFVKTDYGTPQGGVISPLLANIALHGMESYLKDHVQTIKTYWPAGNIKSIQKRRDALGVIRYADDFVIMHESKEIVLKCKELVTNFLKEVGLELSAAKTRMTHTLELKKDDVAEEGFDGKKGFNFLGFYIAQYHSKYNDATSNRGERTGFKTLINPSKEKMNLHQKRMHDVILKNGKKLNQDAMIKILNPMVAGWSRYFGVSDASTCNYLTKMDYLLYLKLRKWASRKSKKRLKGHSMWKPKEGRKWVFATYSNTLVNHADFSLPLNSYVKVKGDASPFDGKALYWAGRLGRSTLIPPRNAFLLKRQKLICTWCKGYFGPEDVMEVDHIIPKSLGGSSDYKNLQLLHRHCHDAKTATDGSVSNTDKILRRRILRGD